MKTIAVISTTGGAGRTTLTATLAVLLARRRRAVVAVDFDPQNLLGTYLGLDTVARAGLARALVEGAELWRGHTWRNAEGVLFSPHGELSLDERARCDAHLAEAPHWLGRALTQIDLPETGAVFLDTPRFPSRQAEQAVRCADLALCVVPPEPAACVTLVRRLAELQALGARVVAVVNRLNPARDMQRDALALLRAAVGDTLAIELRIHADAAMPEALARGTWFFDDAPHSQAAHDLQGVANWIDAWLAEQASSETRGPV